jgi:WD40 repeat protein/tRNA A-37 threonylcarbamoyl transferase component Bud32
VEAACDAFEDAWQAALAGGARPAIEDRLGEVAEEQRLALVRELVVIEAYYRARAGERPGPEDYLARFPNLGRRWLERKLRRQQEAAVPSVVRTVLTLGLGQVGPQTPACLDPAREARTVAPGPRAPEAPPVPAVAGYEVLGELGRGGMGVVYKARQVSLDRVVALKMILHGEYVGAEERRRFQAEAEAVARLSHPHVVQVHEVGEHQGLPYFSLEFCPGGSLADQLDGTPWQPREAAALVRPLAGAVQAAHAKGIVHRDLKPANVLLAEDGTPKVTDFGLAKRLDTQGQTQTGAVVGTPSYMAPEQAGGSKGVGPAADVYALGAILYELLTGRPPFKAATALDTVLQVLSEEPVPVRRLQPKVPRDLETVCARCLEKDPARRFASAQDLAEDLRRFGAGEPVTARPVGWAGRAARWARRRPAVAGLLAALALVALAGGSLVLWYWHQTWVARDLAEERAGSEAEAHRLASERARSEAEARRLAEAQLYFSNIALGQREWLANNARRLEDLLDGCPESLRSWEWHYLDRQRRSALLTRSGPPLVRTTSVAFSPDGRLLATGGQHGVQVWDAASGERLHELRDHADKVLCVAFRPGGTELASGGKDRTVRLWDARTDKPGRALPGHSGAVTGVAYSPDGRRLASAGQDGLVKVWDPDTGRELKVLRGHTAPVTALAFSPDGRLLATGSAYPDGRVLIWDVQAGRQVLALCEDKTGITGVAFRPGTSQLAASGLDNTVRVWDTQTGKLLGTLAGHALMVTAVAYSPDGQRLTSAGSDQAVKVLDASNGRELFALRGHRAGLVAMAYSPDARQLATVADDDTLKVWSATAAPDALVIPGGKDADLSGLAFSPDGKRLASAVGRDRTVWLWEAATGRKVLSLKGPPDEAATVAFSPDGGRLAGAGEDGAVTVWDLATGQRLLGLRGPGVEEQRLFRLPAVAFSRGTGEEPPLLAWAGRDGTVKVWDAGTGREVRNFRSFPPPGGLAPDPEPVKSAAFSPDGRRLAVGGVGVIRVWEVASAREVHTLRGDFGAVDALALSPDGQLLAAATSTSALGTAEVAVWDLSGGRPVATFAGHASGTRALAFSPDGRRLASAGLDRTVRVWDPRAGRELLALPLSARMVRGLAFDPDGRRLAAEGFDALIVWDGSPRP